MAHIGGRDHDELQLGAPYEPTANNPTLYHGFCPWYTDSIKANGIYQGGTSRYRDAIHLTTTIVEYEDEVSGQLFQGVKGNRYVRINAFKLVEKYRERMSASKNEREPEQLEFVMDAV